MAEFFKEYIYAPYLMTTTTEVINSRDEQLLITAKQKHIALNRENKINSILGEKHFIEIKLEDIPEYKEYQNSGFNPTKIIKNRYQTCSTNGQPH